MSSAALSPDGLLPRPAGGLAPGAALALVIHAGLVAALTLGVDWRSHPPEVFSAELWAALPQAAAPPPPPPPLPEVAAPAPPAPVPKPEVKAEVPREADIAVERERRLKDEQKKLEDERKKQEAAAELKRKAEDKKAEAERKKREAAEAARAAEEKAEDERLAKQRQENLRRMMGQATTTPSTSPGTTGSTGTAAQNAAPSATYLGRIRAAVLRELVFTGNVANNGSAEVAVTAAPGGTILSSRLIKSSGSKDYDAAVLRALDKLGSLPRDTDGRVPPSFTLVFRQNE